MSSKQTSKLQPKTRETDSHVRYAQITQNKKRARHIVSEKLSNFSCFKTREAFFRAPSSVNLRSPSAGLTLNLTSRLILKPRDKETRSIVQTLTSISMFINLTLIALFFGYIKTASSTVLVRPSSGRATLMPGQPLHLECSVVNNKNAQFKW